MYEVTLATAGIQQLGWATVDCRFTNEEGVGDSNFSCKKDPQSPTSPPFSRPVLSVLADSWEHNVGLSRRLRRKAGEEVEHRLCELWPTMGGLPWGTYPPPLQPPINLAHQTALPLPQILGETSSKWRGFWGGENSEQHFNDRSAT